MEQYENRLLSYNTDEYPLSGYEILGRNDEGYFDENDKEEENAEDTD